jgi:hypothetical protein
MVGIAIMASVRQPLFVELQAAMKAFMLSPDASLEISELVIIGRI